MWKPQIRNLFKIVTLWTAENITLLLSLLLVNLRLIGQKCHFFGSMWQSDCDLLYRLSVALPCIVYVPCLVVCILSCLFIKVGLIVLSSLIINRCKFVRDVFCDQYYATRSNGDFLQKHFGGAWGCLRNTIHMVAKLQRKCHVPFTATSAARRRILWATTL